MSYLESCYYSVRLLEKLRSLDHKMVLNFDLIHKAINWAKKYHKGQFRQSGEPFYTHPLEVAYMVAEYKLTTDMIVASILHDIIEDTEVTVGMIVDHFSWRIAEMVDRLTRDRPDGTKFSIEQILNKAYQLKDEEVLFIKFFDRMHNASTVRVKSLDKIKKLIDNTLDNFIVLAEYLSLFEQEQKLANICLSLSQPSYRPICFSLVKMDIYRLPVLDFQNEINQIYNPQLQG